LCLLTPYALPPGRAGGDDVGWSHGAACGVPVPETYEDLAGNRKSGVVTVALGASRWSPDGSLAAAPDRADQLTRSDTSARHQSPRAVCHAAGQPRRRRSCAAAGTAPPPPSLHRGPEVPTREEGARAARPVRRSSRPAITPACALPTSASETAKAAPETGLHRPRAELTSATTRRLSPTKFSATSPAVKPAGRRSEATRRRESRRRSKVHVKRPRPPGAGHRGRRGERERAGRTLLRLHPRRQTPMLLRAAAFTIRRPRVTRRSTRIDVTYASKQGRPRRAREAGAAATSAACRRRGPDAGAGTSAAPPPGRAPGKVPAHVSPERSRSSRHRREASDSAA
jgi:hypothetical protein